MKEKVMKKKTNQAVVFKVKEERKYFESKKSIYNLGSTKKKEIDCGL